jgi:hypothetical protein
MILCDTGYGDCNALGVGVGVADGCETTLNSPTHCHMCGATCTYAHALASCETGSCLLVNCNQGFDNCNQSLVDGCEADLASDGNNCGVCARRCENPHGLTQCASGVCSPMCDTSWAACGQPELGCTVNLLTDSRNCGSCGHVCKGGSCTGGICIDCPDAEPRKDTPCTTTVVCGPYSGTGTTACNCYCVNNLIDCRMGTMSGDAC